MTLSHLETMSPRTIPLPLLVAAPLALAAGWMIGTGLARMFRTRVTVSNRASGHPFDPAPPRVLTEDDLHRDEVVRALLDSDQERYDELGRPVHMPRGALSQRRQGAAPLDLTNVEE